MKANARQSIIDTATKLIGLYGYQAISVNQIITDSHTSKGSFYYYFPQGKEDVVVEIVEL